MKKLLLLSCLALTASAAWGQTDQSFAEDEYQITVDLNSGSLCRSNGQWSDTHSAAAKWSSTKVTDKPEVTLSVVNNANNIAFVRNLTGNDHTGFDNDTEGDLVALYAGGVNYQITTIEGWYVSNVAFDVTSNIEGVQLTIQRVNYPVAASAHNNFEFQHQFGDEVRCTISQSSRSFVAMSNFVVTVKRAKAEDLLPAALGKYNFEQYPQLFTAEGAAEANQAIQDKASELESSDLTISEMLTELITVADAQYEKLCAEQMGGHYFMFQNRNTSRYLACAEKTDGSGDYESKMIANPDGNDPTAIWLLTWDSINKKFRLHNYDSDYDLMNTTAQNAQIPMASHENMDQEGPGALFTITPVKISLGGEDIYVIEFKDSAESGYHYIHDGSRLNYPIKWNDAEGSPGSGWYASLVNVNPDGDLAGLLDYDGKQVLVYNVTQQKYLAGIGEKGLGFVDDLRPSAVWTFNGYTVNEGHDQANIELRSAVSGKYVRNLTSDLTDTDQSNLEVDNVEGEFETWYIYTRNGNSADADKFIISEFTADNMAQIISNLSFKFAYVPGDEPGQYVLGDDVDETEYNNIKASIETINGEDGFDFAAAQKAYEFEVGTPTIFDLNALEGPALIRISTIPESNNTSKAYVINSNYNTDEGATVTYNSNADAADNENTIFVLHDGSVASYLDGKYLKTDDTDPSHPAVPFMWESEDVTENVGASLLFEPCVSNSVGSYAISYYQQSAANNPHYYMYCNGFSTSRGSATSAQGYVSHIEKQNNWYGYFFNVEYVKQLSVEVEGYKLWRAPVTVNFGDYADNGAYVVEVVNNTIKTEAAEPETNYGAGTVFVLTKSIIVNCVNGDNTAAKAAGLGHHAMKQHTFSADKVYLTIHDDQSPEQVETPETQGLYFDAPEDVQKVRLLVKKVDADATETLEAHSPVIEAEPTADAELKDGDALMLPLGGSTDTTEILEVAGLQQAAGGIYDLQGRRLAAPVKGLNIINGKKTVIK